jgi:GNAT superfamily N-acetyltransferase
MSSAGPPADRAQLLRLMDLNMWEMVREWTRLTRGAEMLETPALTLTASPRGAFFNNLALVRDAIAPDAVVAELDRFYGERGWPFALMLRGHADGALEAALVARGFNLIVSEPGMTLAADPGPRPVPAGLEITATTTDQGRRDFLHVSAESYATYEQPRDYTADAFATLASVCSPTVQGFVGSIGGAPVAAAALYLTHGVAGIGWVGTVPDARGRGYAEAVTWAAVREGFRRGGAFANLQASPMGKAVYERMGFATPTEYHLLVRAL